ncbi:endochitinase A-like [Pararge aegeria]|nr:endochitinase A-like [Pararge aegeria]
MGTQHLCCKGFCTKGVVAQAIRTSSTTSVVEPSTSTSTSTSTTSTTTTTTSTTTTTTTPSTTTSTTTTTTTTTPKPTTTTTTTEPPRPFLQLLPIQLVPTAAPAKIGKSQKLACPKNVAGGLFPIPCESNAQCRASSGPGQVCCGGQCVKGIPAPRPKSEESHQPILGVIPRECPATPLGELLFEVQTCKTDSDCWPRVCCPDGTRSYCRTARARLDLVPVANRIEAPVRMLESYLQCTAPPQFDSFPQRCSSSIDCFPNLCCAEGGKKHCRPPQRSLFAFLAGAAARLG